MARVLIAEDEIDVADSLIRELEKAGYDPTAVYSDGEAIVSFKSAQETGESFDVVIADMRMDEDDSGLKILREVKNVDSSVEVIILTGYGEIENGIRAIVEGAFDYIQKTEEKFGGVNVYDFVVTKVRHALISKRIFASFKSDEEVRILCLLFNLDYSELEGESRKRKIADIISRLSEKSGLDLLESLIDEIPTELPEHCGAIEVIAQKFVGRALELNPGIIRCIIRALAREDKSGLLKIWPAVLREQLISEQEEDKSITILHILDLHYSEHHRDYDSSFKGFPDRSQTWEYICSDLESLGYIEDRKVDYIIVSGDLTWNGNPNQFEWANKFLGNLTKGLKINRKNVLIVPGNHDITWVEEDESKENKLLPKEDANLNYRSFYNNFYGKKPERYYLSQVIFGENVAVVGLNSCRIESEKNAGLGFVSDKQFNACMKKVKAEISKDKLNPDCTKIAVLHHHIVPVSHLELIPDKPNKLSLILDAESMMKSLLEEGFSMVLHGHQHQPFYSIECRIYPSGRGPTGDKKILIAGAGSIGLVQRKIGSFGTNHYNLIEICDNTITVESRYRDLMSPNRFVYYDHFQVQR